MLRELRFSRPANSVGWPVLEDNTGNRKIGVPPRRSPGTDRLFPADPQRAPPLLSAVKCGQMSQACVEHDAVEGAGGCRRR